MIILNGIVGVCLLAGGARHGEQRFSLRGASSSLNVLTAMVVLSLVLPNYVSSAPGPTYAPSQLIFVAIVSVILYGTFVMVQTVRHRDYFLPADEDMPGDAHAEPPTNAAALAALGMLLVALIGVVLLAKGLSGIVEAAIPGRAAARHRRCGDRRAGAGAGESGGLSRGAAEPVADQPQSGAGVGARDDRADHSGGGDRVAGAGPRWRWESVPSR